MPDISLQIPNDQNMNIDYFPDKFVTTSEVELSLLENQRA